MIKNIQFYKYQKNIKNVDKLDVLVSTDHDSLCPTAMAHNYSKWPKVQTTKAITKEDSDRLCELFNSREWKSLTKSRFFKIKYYIQKISHLNI